HAQAGAQPLDVVGVEQPVAAWRSPRGDQLLILQEPDLGDRDVVELLAQHPADRADGQIRWEGVGLCCHGQRSMNASRYLPICSSSPSVSRTSSTRSRFTYVPFKLPWSLMWTPSDRCSSAAWSRETVTSSRKISLCGARPIVVRDGPTGNWSPARPPPSRITSVAPSPPEASSPLSA